MWQQVLIILPLTISTIAIKVPVYGKNDSENITEVYTTETADSNENVTDKISKLYEPEKSFIDSYLIPPNPHVTEDVFPDYILAPATYLLPPTLGQQSDYYVQTEAGQSDWYPIQHDNLALTRKVPAPVKLLPPNPPEVSSFVLIKNDTFGVKENSRHGKVYQGDRPLINIPSRQLEPPEDNSELSSHDIKQKYKNIYFVTDPRKPNPKHNKMLKNLNIPFQKVEPTLALHLTPPKPYVNVKKVPTNLYPKKVAKGFQPIPIPVAQFAENTPSVPLANHVEPISPDTLIENDYFDLLNDKNLHQSHQAEQKRNIRPENNDIQQQQLAGAAEDTHGDNVSVEPETSETNYRHPGRNVYPAPLRQSSPASSIPHDAHAPPPAERTEFRMHGMKGPHSYQFGYDTGKGKNRQFRYEERDNDGRVKGHYGYMDRDGKLRVVNYDADPEHGFHAEAPKDSE